MARHETTVNARRWLLLESCIPMLRAYVRRLVRNDEVAKEIVQEVSLSILSSPSPDETGRFSAWSRGVARHVVSREARRRRRYHAELEHDPHRARFARDDHARVSDDGGLVRVARLELDRIAGSGGSHRGGNGGIGRVGTDCKNRHHVVLGLGMQPHTPGRIIGNSR